MSENKLLIMITIIHRAVVRLPGWGADGLRASAVARRLPADLDRTLDLRGGEVCGPRASPSAALHGGASRTPQVSGVTGGAWGGSIREHGVHYTSGVPRERLRSAGSQGGRGVGQYGSMGCTTRRGCLANASGQRGRRGGVGWVNTRAWGALNGGASRTPQVSGVAGGVWGGSIRGRGVYYKGVPRERLRSAGLRGGNTGAILGHGVHYMSGVPREHLRSAGSGSGSIRGRGVHYKGVPHERLRSGRSQGGRHHNWILNVVAGR